MRQYATLSLFLLQGIASAQISIGANEMPHAGDELYRTRAFTNPFLDYGSTGPAHVWDFSGLQADSQELAAYQTVASTNFVYALAYADIFFNPNRANHAIPGVDIAFNELLPIDNPYTFFYRSNSIYEKVGYGVELAGLPVPITFSEHDVIYNLPLNYGDADASFSSWEISLPTLFHYGYEQDRSNEVDGWGAITTPAGTFDVLRVMTTLAGRDTINLDSLGVGFTIDRPLVHEYKWLAEDLRVPVLQINTTELFGFEVITDVWFYDEPRSIIVVPPLASLCPGSTVEVHYQVTGAFNEGSFLIPANDFTAQLSDTTGDFTNAVDIGSVEATGSGTILCTIPSGTPVGTGYRIRVVADSPEFIGTDNGYDLVIGAPPVADIVASGATEFCVGGSVILSTSGGDTYQWQLDGADIVGANDPDLEVTASGVYTVAIANGCGSDLSDPLTVAVYEQPEHLLDPASYLTCDGTPVTITAQNLSGQTGLTYQWYLNGLIISGATDTSLMAADAGDYTLVITNPLSGCEFTTTASTVMVEFAMAPLVSALGSTSFCNGGEVTLVIDDEPGMSYQWYLDGVAIPGATDTLLVAETSGDYSATATTINGCTSAQSITTSVIENPTPAAPVITASGDSLITTGSGDFQWYLNGGPIPGAVDSILVAGTSGDYTVMITDANGCSSTSEVYTYISTGIADLVAGGIDVYPNPSQGLFTIVLPNEKGERFEILDVTGRTILEDVLIGSHTPMDLQGRPAGLYFLRLVNDPASPVTRIIVN